MAPVALTATADGRLPTVRVVRTVLVGLITDTELLHWLARYELAYDEMEKARTALLARQDNWAGRPYAEGRAKITMMIRLKFDEASIVAEARTAAILDFGCDAPCYRAINLARVRVG